jgi:MFS family permease
LSYLGIGVFALIFNLYLVQLGYDEAFIGAFNAVNTLAMGVTCIAIGFLVNRFGAWSCILWGTLEFVLVSVVLCFVTTGPLILVFSALNGLGQAFILTVQMPFIIEWAPRKQATAAAAVSSSLNAASFMVGSLLGGALPTALAGLLSIHSDSVTAYRWTLALGMALTALGLIPILLMQTVRREKHHADFHLGHTQLPSHNERRQVRRDVGALALLGVFLAFGVGAVEPFYNVLLGDMGLRAGSIGLIFALSGLAATLLSLLAPLAFRKLGAIGAQLLTRLAPVPFHLALIVFPSAALVSLGYATRRISGSMAWPIESAHVGGLLPPTARAHAFGLRSAAWNLGYALAAFVSGIVIARTGSYTPAYVALGVFCTLSVLVYVVAYGSRVAAESPAVLDSAAREALLADPS